MFNFGKKSPKYQCKNSNVDLSLDGSGKSVAGGNRLWRFLTDQGKTQVGSEISFRGRRARVVETSPDGGYIEFL